MKITGAIPQLRTTVAAAAEALKRNGAALATDVHDTPWGTRELVIKDDQGHTIYLGERR